MKNIDIYLFVLDNFARRSRINKKLHFLIIFGDFLLKLFNELIERQLKNVEIKINKKIAVQVHFPRK